MGPLIILSTVGIIAAALAVMVWRNRPHPALREGAAETLAGHAGTHCPDGGADFSGDCGSDGGGSGGD